MTQEDGSLQPTSWSVTEDCIFEIALKLDGEPENGQYADVSAQIISKVQVYDATASRSGKAMTIMWEGDEYDVVSPENGMLLGKYVKGWVKSHYRLTIRYQRGYLAKILGESVRFLLQDVNTPALPSNMADIVVLFTISARRMEQAGTLVDLKRAACRKELLAVLHLVLKERRFEEEREEEERQETIQTDVRALTVGSTASVASTENAKDGQKNEVRTFTHKGRVAAMAVSAEEIQNTLGMLKRISSHIIPKFLEVAARILWKEEEAKKERQASNLSDNNVLPAELSREDSFVQQGAFSCMAHSSTGTPRRSVTTFSLCAAEVSPPTAK